MKVRLIILFVLVSNVLANAQAPVADSLVKDLSGAKQDTNRVNKLDAVCRTIFQTGNTDNAVPYVNEELNLSQKLGYKKGEANAFINMNIIKKNKREFSEALNDCEK